MSNEPLSDPLDEVLNEPVLDADSVADAKSKLDAGKDHARAAASELKSAAGVLKQAATEKAGELKEAATAKATELKDTATAKAAELKETATAKAQEFKATASAKATEIREKATESWSEAREKSRTFQVDTEEYVRANPTKSVLTALAAGFVLGLVLRK